VSTLFAAFLGYSPVAHLLGPTVLSHLTVSQQAVLNGRQFFPMLISAPFRSGLHAAFDFSIIACLVAAGASWLRGGKYVYVETDLDASGQPEMPEELVGVVPADA
jgi:hypothetical protein